MGKFILYTIVVGVIIVVLVGVGFALGSTIFPEDAHCDKPVSTATPKAKTNG